MLNRPEKLALVPIPTWYGNAPELHMAGIPADVGAFAEALLFYDRLLVQVESERQLHCLLSWFTSSVDSDRFTKLLEEGSVQFIYFDWVATPVQRNDSDDYLLWNIVEEKPKGLNPDRLYKFKKRVIPLPSRYFSSSRKMRRFADVLHSSVVVVDVDSFGNGISVSRAWVEQQETHRLILQSLVDSLHSTGALEGCPKVEVTVEDLKRGKKRIHSNVSFDDIAKKLPVNSGFGKSVPLAIGTNLARLAWAAANNDTDLYVSNPMLTAANHLISEAVGEAGKVQSGLDVLSTEHSLPDIRMQVNSNEVSAEKILRLRTEVTEFRDWFHQTISEERSIDQAYANDVVNRYGISSRLQRSLEATVATGTTSAVGLATAQFDPAVCAIATSASAGVIHFELDLVKKLCGEWRPKIFGGRLRKATDG